MIAAIGMRILFWPAVIIRWYFFTRSRLVALEWLPCFEYVVICLFIFTWLLLFILKVDFSINICLIIIMRKIQIMSYSSYTTHPKFETTVHLPHSTINILFKHKNFDHFHACMHTIIPYKITYMGFVCFSLQLVIWTVSKWTSWNLQYCFP